MSLMSFYHYFKPYWYYSNSMVYNKVLEFFPILRGYIVHLCLANFSCLPNIEYTSDSRAEIHVSAMTLSLMLYSFMMTKFPKRTPHTLYRYPIFYLPKVTKLVSCALCYTILSTCKTEDMEKIPHWLGRHMLKLIVMIPIRNVLESMQAEELVIFWLM